MNCCKRFHDSFFLQIECWRSVDASYNCITDDELVGIEGNIIDEEIEKAKNQSDFLGDQYIASCGILASQMQKRQDIVDQYYGPNAPCTFDEIDEALDIKATCTKALKQKVTFLESFANTV